MYNKAILVGRLTADPELKTTPNGVSVTSFSIAVNRAYSKGEKQVDFLDIVAWRNTAEFICRYFSKGKAILIEGSIQTRTFVDKNGQSRRAWEIVADSAHFVESKGVGQGSNADISPQSNQAPAYKTSGAEDFADVDDDGDLPF